MLIAPLTFYDSKMRAGMNNKLALLSSLNGIKRPQSSCCSDESLGMTPSMNSVLTQVKRHSPGSLELETRFDENDEEDPFQFEHWLSNMKRAESEDSETTVTSGSSVVESHPLLEELESGYGRHNSRIPMMKALNLGDLDFDDEYTEKDLVEMIPPVFDRKVKQPKIRYNRMSFNKPMIYENDKVELEHWPLSKEQEQEQRQQPECNMNMTLPNKRSRQQTLNPNFLKLYSIEMSSKQKKLLPDINVDDSFLSHLSIDQIKKLDIHSSEEPLSKEDIKLALITRKKLWSNMTHSQRQDLFGEASPWNLKFVIKDHEHTDGQESSLVRVESDVKPWMGDNTLVKNNTMLKPCGKIKLGSNPSSKEVQYVVKGWCDSRFLS